MKNIRNIKHHKKHENNIKNIKIIQKPHKHENGKTQVNETPKGTQNAEHEKCSTQDTHRKQRTHTESHRII